MKKPLNYYGFAFENPEEIYDKDYLKTEKGKKEVKIYINTKKTPIQCIKRTI